MHRFDEAMAAVAARQHSVITLADVRAAGGKLHHVEARVAAGRWIRVHQCVYRLAGSPWTYEGRVLAAIKAAGEGAAASFFCAARLLGLGFPTASVEITIPRDTHFRPTDVIVHTSRDLHKCRIVVVDGIPVTDAARTLLDIGSKLKSSIARRDAVNRARRQGLVDWQDLLVCLAVHARRGRRGIRRLRELVAAGMERDAITETDSELIAYTVLREAGFDDVVTHHIIRDERGEIVADMDLADVARKTNIEIDGDVHLDPDVSQSDEARDFVLRRYYGWTVRRVWWEIPVYKPRKFLEIVRETLGLNGSGDAE
ncbi:MAG TPA: hypothetical protein VHC63_17805 [Acidimicrobiales bacterium]|nr:hypothetical protein [Acidimicrobiales bacterium]